MAQPSRQQRKRGVVMYTAAAVIAAVWVILQRTMASDEVYLQFICIPMPVFAALLAIRAANVMGHRKRVGYVGDDWGHRQAAPELPNAGRLPAPPSDQEGRRSLNSPDDRPRLVAT